MWHGLKSLNNITDNELEKINNTEVEKEESIKKGWFDWTKSTKSKIV